MRPLIIAIACLAVLSGLAPAAARAQLPRVEGIPEALTNPLGFIQEKLGLDLERIFPGFRPEMFEPGQVTGGASTLWGDLKGWTQERLGIDLTRLLRGLVDLVVWVFEFAIKLFRSLLDVL